MKACSFCARFSEAMSFSKFAPSVSKVTLTYRIFFYCFAYPAKVSALALKNKDTE